MKRLFTILTLCFFLANTGVVLAQQYSESNDFSYALKLYNENFYDVAAQQFSTFINRYPNSERQADARFYYADALFKLGQFDNARVEFQGLAVGFPENARAPRAWEMVGKSYEKLGKAEEAAKNEGRMPLKRTSSEISVLRFWPRPTLRRAK